jgi:deoxycytidine triphosphate deaminase
VEVDLQQQFAGSDDEARERFEATRHKDPFTNVAPSLLNTADLLDYVAATGMIYPFNVVQPLDRRLKPASCAIPFAGRAIAWMSDPKKPDSFDLLDRELQVGQKLTLPRNSIVFITLQPYFRFPDYIAGRYNLAITQIYRGLLVGTGPLVDPGFEGLLSVPVHNLTANDYELTAGDPLVWMEFTKLSPNVRWDEEARRSDNPYVAFPQRKLDRRGLGDYLAAASSKPIVSSIPQEVAVARRAAESARNSVRWLQGISIAAGIVLLVTIAAMLLDTFSAVRNEGSDRSALERRVTALQQDLRAGKRELDRMRRQVRRSRPTKAP